MNTFAYEFGYQVGQMVKRADPVLPEPTKGPGLDEIGHSLLGILSRNPDMQATAIAHSPEYRQYADSVHTRDRITGATAGGAGLGLAGAALGASVGGLTGEGKDLQSRLRRALLGGLVGGGVGLLGGGVGGAMAGPSIGDMSRGGGVPIPLPPFKP